jgi:phospholipid/cholesterol/gamma-HCH transport system ATP-binding protein
MIRFERVSKAFGGRKILDEVSLEIVEHETAVIVGFSGAGKSVTLRHMVRLLTPDAGRVLVGKDCVSEATGRDLSRIRRRFGYLFQGSALLQWLTVGDNVALPLRENTDLSEDRIQVLVREKLAMLNLEDTYDQVPSELSGGMRKRVALARAIIMSPDIILYDEPTSGLDPVTSRTIDRLIDGPRTELGVTSVVVTHDLHSALAIGSRIIMLYDGKIIENATPEEFVRSQNSYAQDFLKAQHITRSEGWKQTETMTQ